MPPIPRWSACGPVTIDARLLAEIEAVLMMDVAEPPGVVAPRAARRWEIRQRPTVWEGGRPVALDFGPEPEVHDYLDVDDVHAVQRLRGWHRVRHGRITVSAHWLCETRNVMDGLTLAGMAECSDLLADLERDDADYAAVFAAVDEDRWNCGLCETCRLLRLRDEADAALDAAGYGGGPYYEAYAGGRTL